MIYQEEKSICIVVLGMHRSGTSLITKGLEVLGVNLGDKLFEPRNDNPKGFWEDERIVALNDKILSTLGLDTFSSKPIDEQEISNIPKYYYDNAISIINSLKTCQFFGFKDPRTARLILFWQKVLLLCEIDTRYIIVVRNPLSIANSLEKRDGLHLGLSQLLWLLHILPSVFYTNQKKKILIDYDGFIDDPSFYLNKISKVILSKEVDNITGIKINKYCNSFIDLKLRHNLNTYDAFQSSEHVCSLVKETYEILRAASLNKINIDDVFFSRKIEELYYDLISIYPLCNLIDYHDNQYKDLHKRLHKTKNNINLLMEHPIIKTIIYFGFFPGLKKIKRHLIELSDDNIEF